MIEGQPTQPFASPEEALAHYGVKGMRWGVRRQNGGGSGGGGGTPEQQAQQRMLESVIGKPPGHGSRQDDKDGMPDAQKKALMALGVLGAAGAGYYAYSRFMDNTFMPGGKMHPDYDVSGLKDGPLSDVDLANGGFSAKYPSQALKSATADIPITDYYDIDTSKGYANYLPKKGFPNDFARDRHSDMISTLDEMRAQYPAVKNMKIEVVPMSEVPGMEMMANMGAMAAVMPMGKGEARIMYNDMMAGGFDAIAPDKATRALQEAHIPGMFKEKYLGYHEMGHVLAVANGDMPQASKLFDLDPTDIGGQIKANIRHQAAKNYYHKKTFKKHGFSFKELSKLGKYAASQPAESMAELYGHYHHPEMRKRLTPAQIKKAKKMFDDMGGVPPS